MSRRDEGPRRPEGGRGRDVGLDVEPDVERIHRPLLREPRKPLSEGREPVPWWVWTAGVLVLFWGGWYLGRYGGPFGTATHVALGSRDVVVSREVAEEATAAALDPVAAGQQLYVQNCQSCHQPGGMGLPGVFPPLVGSEWVTGAPETVVRVLLKGLQGPIEVAGQTFNGVMPAWENQLSDVQIAAVATYIRQWESNDAPEVDPKLVGELRGALASRAQPWTAAELRAAEAGGGGEAGAEAGSPAPRRAPGREGGS